MNLKKQIAVIVLALTATTSPVWSQDTQTLASPNAQTLQGTWRVTRPGVDCITGRNLLISGYHDLQSGRHFHRLWVPPGEDPGQGTEYGVWQREPGRHNYSVRAVSYGYTAEGDFAFRAEATEAIQLTSANSFTRYRHGPDLRR